jgi:hypothetical protein
MLCLVTSTIYLFIHDLLKNIFNTSDYMSSDSTTGLISNDVGGSNYGLISDTILAFVEGMRKPQKDSVRTAGL